MADNQKPTFGVGGRLDSGLHSIVYEIQADDKLIVTGINKSTGQAQSLRFLDDGSIDPSFNGESLLTNIQGPRYTDFRDSFVKKRLPNGEWLVEEKSAIYKQKVDGSKDSTFGVDGRISLYLDGLDTAFNVHNIEYSPQGQILVTGSTSDSLHYDKVLVRYHSDGTLDTGFNGIGYQVLSRAYDVDIAFQADQKILVSYNKYISGKSAVVMRVNQDGTIDTDFADQGYLYPFKSLVYQVETHSDGSFFLVGSPSVLAKFNNSGELDVQFGKNGFATTGFTFGYDIFLTSDDKLIVYTGGETAQFHRFNANGTLDQLWSPKDEVHHVAEYTVSEYSQPVLLSITAQVYDADLTNTHYGGSSITIQRRGGAVETDRLNNQYISNNQQVVDSQTNQTIGSAQLDGGKIQINFNEHATQTSVNNLLSNFNFESQAPIARPTLIDFEWTFNDGNTGRQGTGGALTAVSYSQVKLSPRKIQSIDNVLNATTVNVSVKGDPRQIEQHEQIFNTLKPRYTDGAIDLNDKLRSILYPSYVREIAENRDDKVQFVFTNGDVYQAWGANLTKDDYTITRFEFRSVEGIVFEATGHVNFSSDVQTSSGFTQYTITDYRTANPVVNQYTGDISLYGEGQVIQHTVSSEGLSKTITGDFQLEDADVRGTVKSLTFVYGDNSIAFSNFSLGTIALPYMRSFGETYASMLNATNQVQGTSHNDFLEGGYGDDTLIGGAGADTAYIPFMPDEVTLTYTKKAGTVVKSIYETDVLIGVENIVFLDGTTDQQYRENNAPKYQSINTQGQEEIIHPDIYTGAVSFIEYEFLGDAQNNTLVGSDHNDFINLLLGDDAAEGGLGDDVLDGGEGSNFLTGGGGDDTFFLDGRGGQVTWSTVADFSGDEVNIWGWEAGISRILLTENNAGADGYEGATFHYDLNDDGHIDISLTFSGLSIDEVPKSAPHTVASNGYLAIL